MYGYIYLTTNLVNNKKYIGRHKAEKFDKNYLGSGIILNSAIKKYGRRNFDVKVLCECNSSEELDKMEIELISEYDAVNSSEFYNIAMGGHHNVSIANLQDQNPEGYQRYRDGLKRSIETRQSEEHRKKLSRLFSENPPALGLKHTEETKRKIAKYGNDNPFYGKHHSEETKTKISKANTGRKHTPEESAKMTAAHIGKKHTEETKRKMAEARRRYWKQKHELSSATTIENIKVE